MNTDIAKIEDHLKDLVSKNEDAIKGFEKASENSKEVGIKSYFEKKVIDRMQFLRELRAAVPELDLGSVEIEGSAAGTLHRTWMDVKAFFAEDNDEAMLEEAVRGDKAAINDYDNALAEVMMTHRLKEIIRAQKYFLQNDLETTEILEHHR
ncbi:PA2169 family four-helix-bundle protein [Maribacter sp. 1_MG-2023]|uniref:ferritin-like domain-containing protein n=1 Tax=Maribacter sp. 1_MG-2023 TaxID=3062677 RepID=UPI0026E2CA33|nr:PA2169 family four-helix-bundle protein [Maribacter sp. 1_MG-2023]MDO6472596.1 PA2169 family four-helix-bundle protein [Maribacter sp. 1_MG-2023]